MINKKISGCLKTAVAVVGFVLIVSQITAVALENESFEYSINDDNKTVSIMSCFLQNEKIEIPEKIDNYEVTEIASDCFAQNKIIKKIKFPDSIEVINSFAFSDCINLESIEFGNSVNEIGKYSFSGCESDLSLDLPESVTIIDDYAFSGNISLEYIKLGDNIKTIGEYAFYNCNNVVFYCDEDTKTYKTLTAYLKKYPLSGYTISEKSLYQSKTEETEQETDAIAETTKIPETENIITTQTEKKITETKTTAKAKITTTTTKSKTEIKTDSSLLGDYNLDGAVNSSDAVESLKYYANQLAGKEYDLKCTFENADVSGDKKINSVDAVIILKYYAQKILGYGYDLKTYLSR
jgi:hypothetical protein